jgi:hypothetical protein
MSLTRVISELILTCISCAFNTEKRSTPLYQDDQSHCIPPSSPFSWSYTNQLKDHPKEGICAVVLNPVISLYSTRVII